MNSQNVEKKTGTHTKLHQLCPWFTRTIFLGLFLWTFLCKSLIVLVMRVSPLMFVLWACSGFRGAFHSVLGWTSLGIVLAIFVLCVIFPRCFCRFLCPQGTIFTVLRKVRTLCLHRFYHNRLSSNVPLSENSPFQNTRSVTSACWAMLPVRRKKRLQMCAGGTNILLGTIGSAIAVLLVVGAIIGLETNTLGLWADPLVMLRAWRTPWRLQNVAMLLCLLIWSCELGRPGGWCRNFCPTGAVQDFLAAPIRYWKRWHRNRVKNVIRTGCHEHPPYGLTRYRRRIAWVATCGWASLFYLIGSRKVSHAERIQSTKRTRLRPPGAVPERQFMSLCARCGNCATVCPTGLIYHPLEWSTVSATSTVTSVPTANQSENPSSHLLANPPSEFHELGVPVLRFDPAYCETRCTACTEVCQTGALTPLTVEEKKLHPIGLATLDWARCLLYESHECRICARECPQLAIDIVWSEEEYLPVPTIDAANCTGCGRCLVFCPAKCLVIIPR